MIQIHSFSRLGLGSRVGFGTKKGINKQIGGGGEGERKQQINKKRRGGESAHLCVQLEDESSESYSEDSGEGGVTTGTEDAEVDKEEDNEAEKEEEEERKEEEEERKEEKEDEEERRGAVTFVVAVVLLSSVKSFVKYLSTRECKRVSRCANEGCVGRACLMEGAAALLNKLYICTT